MVLKAGVMEWDLNKLKKKALHTSFVGATDAGKTYLVRHLLQLMGGFWQDGAVFWVATQESWDSNKPEFKVSRAARLSLP